MLQNSGWSEGQPLGCSVVTRRNGHDIPPSRKRKAKEEVKLEEEEVQCEGFDDVIELKTKKVIDLTVSDSSDSEEVEDYEQPPLPPSPPAPSGSTSLDHGGKALLTPIPTVLKSDRLGIGLKARTYGPYKASRKRVTHNAAALAAHVKSHEDLRKLKTKFGRGSRGFAKLNQRDIVNRRDLLAYLNN